MKRIVIGALAALVAACSSHAEFVTVEIDEMAGCLVNGADHLSVSVTERDGTIHHTDDVPVAGKSLDRATFTIQFAVGTSGAITVAVDAVDAHGATLAKGSAKATLPLTGSLHVAVAPDGCGGADMTAPTDMAPMPADMTELADMTMSDLAMPDLAVPDLAVPDLAMPDLAMPDLAMPDLAMPDLAKPDLAMPDLAMPDLMITWPWGDPTYSNTSEGITNGVLHVHTGETKTLQNGRTYYLVSLTVEAGGHLVVSPGDNWTFIGSAGNVVIDGDLTGSAGQNSTSSPVHAPAADGTATGETLMEIIPAPATGGAGGLGGPVSCGGLASSSSGFPEGGKQLSGNGGGGGGGWPRGVSSSTPQCNSYQCPSGWNNCWYGDPNVPGQDATAFAGGNGGLNYNNSTGAAVGAPLYGMSGMKGMTGPNPEQTSGGGSGGSRGYHGQRLYIATHGSVSGMGYISADGTAGGAGGGSAAAPGSNGSNYGTPGGGGGGGAGGNGGAIVIRAPRCFLFSNQMHAKGGLGGIGGVAGTPQVSALSSQNGFPGSAGIDGPTPDVGPLPY